LHNARDILGFAELEANASCGTLWLQCKVLGLLVFYTPIGRKLNQPASL